MKNQVLIAALCAAVSGSVFAQKQNWEWVARVSFSRAGNFSNGVAHVKSGSTIGYVFDNGGASPVVYETRTGWEIYGAIYQSDGRIRVKKNDQYGFIDERGKLVIPTNFLWAGHFSEGLANVVAEDGAKMGYIDPSGAWAIQPQFSPTYRGSSYVHEFSEGLAAQENNAGQMGFIDKQGNWAIQPQFDRVKQFKHGLAPVSKNDKWGAIDKTGKLVIPYQAHIIDEFLYPNWTTIRRVSDNKIGMIDRTGKVLHAPQFYQIEKMEEGRVRVEKNYLYGFIDADGKMVIPVKYSSCQNFSDGNETNGENFITMTQMYIT